MNTVYMYSIGIEFPQQKNKSEKLARTSLLTSGCSNRCHKRSNMAPTVATSSVYAGVWSKSPYVQTVTNTMAHSSKIPIQCPKKTNLAPDIKNDTYISNEKYRVASTNGLYDPTEIHTPPTDFMKQLKDRMSVYFTPNTDVV